MIELVLPDALAERMRRIYQAMEEEYDAVARQLSFGCTGCPDNCCDSYFLHYTYVEWAYLWRGMRQLPAERQQEIIERARLAVRQYEEKLGSDQFPVVMCPLNENGLCVLYPFRLLVCRTHGVPAMMTRPDGRRLTFPGCFRCQEIVGARNGEAGSLPMVDRTNLLRQLAMLENEFLRTIRDRCPKIRMTIAEILIEGPPKLP
jgi:hypothetical protein